MVKRKKLPKQSGGAKRKRGRRTRVGDEENCAICLNRMGLDRVILGCQHHFHRDCVAQWFNTVSTCPVCRSNIRTLEYIQLPNPPVRLRSNDVKRTVLRGLETYKAGIKWRNVEDPEQNFFASSLGIFDIGTEFSIQPIHSFFEISGTLIDMFTSDFHDNDVLVFRLNDENENILHVDFIPHGQGLRFFATEWELYVSLKLIQS